MPNGYRGYNPYGATLGALGDIGQTVEKGIQDYIGRKQQERDRELQTKLRFELPMAQQQAQTDIGLKRLDVDITRGEQQARFREDEAERQERERIALEEFRTTTLAQRERALPTKTEREVIGGRQYVEELTGESVRPEVFEPWAQGVFGDLLFGRNTRAEWNKTYTNIVTGGPQKKDFDRRQQILKGLRTEFDDDLKALSYDARTGFAGAPPDDPSINELRARVAPYGEVKINVMRLPVSTDPLKKPVPEWVGEMTLEEYQQYTSGEAVTIEGGATSLTEDEGRLVFDYDIDINPALKSARTYTPYTEFEEQFDTPTGFDPAREPVIAGDGGNGGEKMSALLRNTKQMGFIPTMEDAEDYLSGKITLPELIEKYKVEQEREIKQGALPATTRVFTGPLLR